MYLKKSPNNEPNRMTKHHKSCCVWKLQRPFLVLIEMTEEPY